MTAPPSRLSVRTAHGWFELRPVDPEADLALVHRWMHAEHVVPFWRQAWSPERIASYLTGQLDGAASRPCLGLLDDAPMSYWEIYRAADDPVAEVYPAGLADLGVHLLLGERNDTGRGLGSALLRTVRDGLFAADRRCPRLVAEPDIRNTASIRAFSNAGFVRVGEVSLPKKRAMLMASERGDPR